MPMTRPTAWRLTLVAVVALAVAGCSGKQVAPGLSLTPRAGLLQSARGPIVRVPTTTLGRVAAITSGEKTGSILPYRHRARLEVLVTLKNVASVPVTVLDATMAPRTRHPLLRRIGTHTTLVPDSPSCPAGRGCPPRPPGIRAPYGAAEPQPLVVPPSRLFWVQINLRMGNCRYFRPGARRTYLRTMTVTLERVGRVASQAFLLHGSRVTVIAPKKCPAQRAR
jgi:hypothetical protein